MKYSTDGLPSSTGVQQPVNGIYNDGFQPDLINDGTDETSKVHVAVVSKEQLEDKDHKEENEKECEDGGDDIATFCGVNSCRPSFMQCCMNMAAFSAIFSVSGLVTAALGAYIITQITTLEKQFNFSSSVSGVIMSCNDIGYLATTLFMSYYTRRVHIPRAMALSTILFGVSGILCAVAFFGTRDQLPSPPKNNAHGTASFSTQTCQTTTTLANSSCNDASGAPKTPSGISDYWKQVAIVIIAVSMILQGIAKSPRQPFVLTYVDDNVAKIKTSLYFGIIIGVSFFGPSVAFGLGAVFNNMYITLEDTNITPRDPRWLGAWWLGFLIFGVVSLVVGLPLICFPKRMRSQKNVDIVKHKKNVNQKQFQRLWHDFKVYVELEKMPRNELSELPEKTLEDCMKTYIENSGILQAVLTLILNPVYVCCTLGSSVNLMMAIGMISFFNKYLETQFTLTASQSNLILGVVNFVITCIGTATGGCITTRLRLSPLACLKFIIGANVVATLIFAIGFVVGCDQPVLGARLDTNSSTNQTISQCVLGCNCDDTNYFPICGNDGNNYFSPCHAGCLSMDGMVFTNCSCLTTNENQTATGGLCESDCHTLYPYLIIFCTGGFIAALTITSNYIVCIRCVKEEDKPFAVGLMSFVETLIGWLPGPIIFGGLVDSTCMLWKTTCGSVGACALYDTEIFRFRYHALVTGLRVIAVIVYTLAIIIAVCSKKQVFLLQIDNNVVAVPIKDKDTVEVVKAVVGELKMHANTESVDTHI